MIHRNSGVILAKVETGLQLYKTLNSKAISSVIIVCFRKMTTIITMK